MSTDATPPPASSEHGPANGDGARRLDRQFPCVECGGEMRYSPSDGALVCPYCSHRVEAPTTDGAIEELDFREWLAAAEERAETEDVQVVHCVACGAETKLAPNLTASECAFCGTPIVTTRETRRRLRPRSLLPFHIAKQDALSRWRTWLESLWFAPNELRKRSEAETRLRGVYVPYWTYDSEASSFYTGQRGDDYWVTVPYTTVENGRTVTRTRSERRTRWTSVQGAVWNAFDDVLILASHSLPRGITEKLEPWDLQNLAGYDDTFLSGFEAESYQVDLGEGFARAERKMDEAIRASVRRDIGGDHQRISTLDSRHDNVTFKHILLPIWISTYRYREKAYHFVVNARTGEVQGERPWSWLKILLLILTILAVAGALLAVFKS